MITSTPTLYKHPPLCSCLKLEEVFASATARSFPHLGWRPGLASGHPIACFPLQRASAFIPASHLYPSICLHVCCCFFFITWPQTYTVWSSLPPQPPHSPSLPLFPALQSNWPPSALGLSVLPSATGSLHLHFPLPFYPVNLSGNNVRPLFLFHWLYSQVKLLQM